jgi:hypothetical protein
MLFGARQQKHGSNRSAMRGCLQVQHNTALVMQAMRLTSGLPMFMSPTDDAPATLAAGLHWLNLPVILHNVQAIPAMHHPTLTFILATRLHHATAVCKSSVCLQLLAHCGRLPQHSHTVAQ